MATVRVTVGDAANHTVTQDVTVNVSAAPLATTRIGMSSPKDQWAMRLAQVGGHVCSRRMFGTNLSWSSLPATPASELAAGRTPILSWKVPNHDWAAVAAGTYDSQLNTLRNNLAALAGEVFVAIHHEPDGDGTQTNFANMQRRALPILGQPANVKVGIMGNGWWWSPFNQGLTDAEIAAWIPADVRAMCDFISGDCYSAPAPSADTSEVKIRGLSAWATRVGVTQLGVAEYNALNAAQIAAAGDAILDDPRIAFASIWNSDAVGDWVLTGSEITAFQATVAASGC